MTTCVRVTGVSATGASISACVYDLHTVADGQRSVDKRKKLQLSIVNCQLLTVNNCNTALVVPLALSSIARWVSVVTISVSCYYCQLLLLSVTIYICYSTSYRWIQMSDVSDFTTTTTTTTMSIFVCNLQFAISANLTAPNWLTYVATVASD